MTVTQMNNENNLDWAQRDVNLPALDNTQIGEPSTQLTQQAAP